MLLRISDVAHVVSSSGTAASIGASIRFTSPSRKVICDSRLGRTASWLIRRSRLFSAEPPLLGGDRLDEMGEVDVQGVLADVDDEALSGGPGSSSLLPRL
jgi:hypothetical protein